MAQKGTSIWLSRVLFESVLIVVSIVLALALDEWREDRQDAEMINTAMANFLLEIQQNKARVDDVAPFNRGLRDVLRRRYESDGVRSLAEFVSIVESYSPNVLQASAWETALATGTLAKMDYELVSALSLTYSLQNRYQELVRGGLSELTSAQNLDEQNLRLAVFNSIRYLDDVTRLEVELSVTYGEAAAMIAEARRELQAAQEDADALAQM